MRTSRSLAPGIALAVGVAACGCSSAAPHTLGTPVGSLTPVAVRSLPSQKAAAPVVVEGEMIEKCPVAGCWFVLRDKTGVVRVDTKGGGFVVSEVPLHARVIVAGAVTPGAQPGIAATGVRY